MYQFAVADIRLVGSPWANEGRLEVKVAGIWGTVCDDYVNDVVAGVACFMLGYGCVSQYARSCVALIGRKTLSFTQI